MADPPRTLRDALADNLEYDGFPERVVVRNWLDRQVDAVRELTQFLADHRVKPLSVPTLEFVAEHLTDAQVMVLVETAARNAGLPTVRQWDAADGAVKSRQKEVMPDDQ